MGEQLTRRERRWLTKQFALIAAGASLAALAIVLVLFFG